MSRLVTHDVDHLFIVSDPSPRGMLTAKRMIDLINELRLHIKNWHIIVNKVRDNERDNIFELARAKSLEITGCIGEDSSLLRADAEGVSIFSLSRKSIVITDSYSIFNKSILISNR
jgi:CO dehydrogenase maturation factor